MPGQLPPHAVVDPARAGQAGGAVRIEQLTALRFLAALAVLSSHLWQLEDTPNPLQPLARTLFHEGYAGVSFFFVLSGFILSHTYRPKLVQRTIGRGHYLALRIARIYPLHLLTALPFAIALLLGRDTAAWPAALANLALLQSWVPQSAVYFSLNEPSWSLSDEVFFYAAFAGLALVAPRRLALATSLLAAGMLALTGWLVATGHGAIRSGEAMTLTHWLTYINPVARLLDFMVGMLLYHAPRPRLDARTATLLEAGAVALLLGAMAAFPLLGVAEAWRMQLAYLPFMALTIHAFALGRGAVSGWLGRSRGLVLLGDASFALYLIHLPILHGAFALYDRADSPPLPLAWFAGLVAAVAVAGSVAVFLGIERPLQRRLRRLLAAPDRTSMAQNATVAPSATVRGDSGA